jgi:hypothetical protein
MSNHHPGCEVTFFCIICQKNYKNKHAALCHVPKCRGAMAADEGQIECSECHRVFMTQRGLSQHERLVHPNIRNEKRAQAATGKAGPTLKKAYGKVWQEDEIAKMVSLEYSLLGHPRMAQQMAAHLPGKTTKQIRDKRREPNYKALVASHKPEDRGRGTRPPSNSFQQDPPEEPSEHESPQASELKTEHPHQPTGHTESAPSSPTLQVSAPLN